MSDVAGTLAKKVGPLPISGWIVVVGGVGAGWFVIQSRNASKPVTNVVDEVAVPVAVGAVASPDYAPSIYQSVSYFDSAAVNSLTDTVAATNTALLGNTEAIGQNTGAITGNTAATAALTGTVQTLTTTIATTPPVAPTQTPAATTTPAAIPSTTVPVAAQVRTYMVKSGDTLSGIAKRYTGNSARWREIYNINAAQIDARARRAGYTGSFYNHIWPGQIFTIPSGW